MIRRNYETPNPLSRLPDDVKNGQEFHQMEKVTPYLDEGIFKNIEETSYLLETWKNKLREFDTENLTPDIGVKLLRLFRPLKKYSFLIHSVVLLLSTTGQAKEFNNQFYEKYSHENKVIDFSRKFNQIMDLSALASKKESEILHHMRKNTEDDDLIQEDTAYLGV